MTQWIGAISRGHNAAACLLKDGEVVFNIEEERLTRAKYDGAPLLAMTLFKKYTKKLDRLLIAHTSRIELQPEVKMDYCGHDPYYTLARKMQLVPPPNGPSSRDYPDEVIDMGEIHHRLHAATAFYNSGFDKAAAVIVDGSGSRYHFGVREEFAEWYWETETIFDCGYPHKFDTVYKHMGTPKPTPFCYFNRFDTGFFCGYGRDPNYESDDHDHCELAATPAAGIVKCYEGVTEYCGWDSIEAGKTMGLAPYGEPCDYIPDFFKDEGILDLQKSDRNIFTPKYPQSALYNMYQVPEINEGNLPEEGEDSTGDPWDYSNRRNSAWKVQVDTQEQILNHIRKAVRMTGHKNVVLSGGYGLNCMANYYYLDQLKDEGINLYVEPVSNDGGTALGAALLQYHMDTKDITQRDRITNLYTGPEQTYELEEFNMELEKCGGSIKDATNKDVIDLILNKNIVALFQGRSEAGPRALGNRSILYDPRDPNGKDHVNNVKHREYFRPFAGSILKEHVHEWFDLRGMDETPFMMYAVKCQEGIEEKIPAIIHVDGTCRIQTVTEEQNKNYYELIQEFFKQTGCPIIFNTSFNLGGEPLVETLDDAIHTLINSDIEYLYLPEYGKMIVVPNVGSVKVVTPEVV